MNGRDNRRRPFKGRNSDRSSRAGASESRHGRPSQGEGSPPDGNNASPVRYSAGISGENKNRGGRNAGDFRQNRRGEKTGYGSNIPFTEKPVWVAPVPNTRPLPAFNCLRCGLPVTDICSAISDKITGKPVHFDCVMADLAEREKPETGEVISYIGGGRFGIVRFNDRERNFSITKIFEWEDKDKRAEWRSEIADHFSVT